MRSSTKTSWQRLATGQGKIGDAAYLIHEIAEVEELQRIQKQTGFKFIGPKNLDQLSRIKRQQWEADFELYYLSAHSKALEAEYEFIAEQVFRVTNGVIKISKLQAAAIDTTRNKEAWQYLLVDGIPMQLHHHFDAWHKPNDKIIPLSKSAQRRLRYNRSTIMLDNLIIYLKNMPIE